MENLNECPHLVVDDTGRCEHCFEPTVNWKPEDIETAYDVEGKPYQRVREGAIQASLGCENRNGR